MIFAADEISNVRRLRRETPDSGEHAEIASRWPALRLAHHVD